MLDMEVDARGPKGDRRYMVVDDRSRFLTQRENPRMAQVMPAFTQYGLSVVAPGIGPLLIPDKGKGRARVKVWKYEGAAEDMGDECARWFTSTLEQSCRLVRFPADVHRKVSKRHSDLDAEVAFSDGYPFLVVSLESWADLNRRMVEPLPMSRFRPNIVLRDCQPYQEDEWKTLESQNLRIDLVKACARCKITTLNPTTLEYGKEPLLTLSRYRKGKKGVLFGQNAVHHAPGRLRVGDEFRVLSLR